VLLKGCKWINKIRLVADREQQNQEDVIKRDIRLIYCFKVLCWRGIARGAS